MVDKLETGAIVDGLLKLMAGGTVLAVGLVAPNAMSALDKPLKHYLKRIDQKQRDRELRNVMRYMKNRGYVSGDYEHGLVITDKGRARAERADLNNLRIKPQKKWDGKWRLVFYDIPEQKKASRNSLQSKLKQMGFYQLQKSIWVSPFPCRKEIEAVGLAYDVAKFMTYIETSYIDKQEVLKKQFHSQFNR